MKINKKPQTSYPTFAVWENLHLNLVEVALAKTLKPLSEKQPPEVVRLVEALAYSLLGGGKRLRPLLALAAAEAVGGCSRAALPGALAVEMVHAYSLVHDDLPAMDDDDLRRGRPTCHKVYGEATAILVGDALLTLAFETLAKYCTKTKSKAKAKGRRASERAAQATVVLARAAGALGMVGGQALDLAFEGRVEEIDEPMFMDMAGRKTGALISVALVLGGIFGGAVVPVQKRLHTLGIYLGLAFQIQDDLLNLQGNPAQLGKAVGSDEKRGKATLPAVAGVEAARVLGDKYLAQSLGLAAGFGSQSKPLVQLIENLVQRQS